MMAFVSRKPQCDMIILTMMTISCHMCAGQITSEPDIACEASGKFWCPETNKCIEFDNICDEEDDCGDNWDEQYCTCEDYGYRFNMLKCPKTNQCIYFEDFCDRIDDCGDNWDERNCLEVENVTLPVCKRQHLCETRGCSNEGDSTRFCHCDRACKLYDDCCIDYSDVCSFDESEFLEILVSRDISKTDLQCVNDYNADHFMITTCNKDLGIVNERCKNPICNDALSNVPVMDSIGISYRNVYCAVCHNVNKSELIFWKASFFCKFPRSGQEPPKELTYRCNKLNNCTLSLSPPQVLPPDSISARKCQQRVIATCNDTTKEANNSCKEYTAKVKFGREIYKNPHCLRCNVDKFNDILTCEGDGIPDYIPRDYIKPPFTHPTNPPTGEFHSGASYAILMNFKLSSSNGLEININGKETIINCDEGEVFIANRDDGVDCVRVSCSDGLKLQDGQCIPDTSINDIPCDRRNGTVKAKLISINASCQDGPVKQAAEKLLIELVDGHVISEDTEDSIECSEDVHKTAILTYTFFGSEDLFVITNDHVESYLKDVAGISNNIQELQIIKSCLIPDVEYQCDSDWIPDNEYILEKTNTTYKVYLNETSEWLTTDGIIFRNRYGKEHVFSGMQRDLELQLCHLSDKMSCPFVQMNVSKFDVSNSTYGIIYLDDGRTFEPMEYKITSRDKILVCNFFNQSGRISDSEMATFFEYSDAQTIVSVIGTVFSLLAIILTLTTYAVFAVLRTRAGRLIINLVISLFVAQFLLLFGGSKTQNKDTCFAIAAIAHYAWLATFAWMNALAFDLDRTFGNPGALQIVSKGNKALILYMVYAYGSPLVVVAPCIGVHFCQCTKLNFQYGSESACWISDGISNLLTFGVPAAVFLLGNGVLFAHTLNGIRSTKKDTAQIRKEESILKQTTQELIIYIRIASLMGFTWIFGYIAAFADVEALWYIYIILNSLQGVFIFISFICNRRVGLLWSEKLHLTGPVERARKTSTSELTSRHKPSTSLAPGMSFTNLNDPSGKSGITHGECPEPLRCEEHV